MSEEAKDLFQVVINHEEQYSIWSNGKKLPGGWKLEGKMGTKEECLAYIDEVWVDMRPLSLRQLQARERLPKN